MATYEFECGQCGKRFEVHATMGEHDRLKDDPPTCPQCGKKDSRQLISTFTCQTPSGYA